MDSRNKECSKQAGEVHITVEFTKGEDSVGRIFKLSDQGDLEQLVHSEISRLDRLYTFADSIKTGPMEIAAIQEPVIDTAKQSFMNALKDYRKGVESAAAGLITAAQLTALKTALKAVYKPEYQEYL